VKLTTPQIMAEAKGTWICRSTDPTRLHDAVLYTSDEGSGFFSIYNLSSRTRPWGLLSF
jgi:hypothetical protein